METELTAPVHSSTSTSNPLRADAQGLRELADFLDAHPALPTPHVFLYASYAAGPATREVAAWVDGLLVIEVEPDSLGGKCSVPRTFAGLAVTLHGVPEEAVGEVKEIPSTKTELVPYTVVELAERAAALDAPADPATAAA
ncbi:MAG TPA: hypothetical protein VFU14_20295 [Acidimicrobiales bacterium]|nr:hypothetical protein [Acidimicrobiales bacterium]